ncbi:MAG: hypothetical protein P8J89_02040 [Phycisphaerales bacterium]|nr:hypothetical protein [Phycisphaerales bacterium]|tara:strand:- start:9394 stop:9900 length:507 start_codon:yes stop_codon:yes gene_type:complete
MRVLVRQIDRSRVGEIQADVEQRPTRVRTLDTDQEVFLDWERAFDDSGQLRRCVICGSDHLFQHKTFPQITPFVIVLAFALSLIGVLGYVTDIAILIGMTGVLLLDIAILFFASTRLVCYRCRSQYRNLEIAEYHQRWDRATDARLRNQSDRRPVENPRRVRSRDRIS